MAVTPPGGRARGASGGEILVVVVTCCRPDLCKRLVTQLRPVLADAGASLLVSIDGRDDALSAWCLEEGVSFLSSEAPEGAGLAKNRAVIAMSAFEHYFFVEDDVEVLEGSFFARQAAFASEVGIGHFVLHEKDRLRAPIRAEVVGGKRLLMAPYGSAQVSYYAWRALSVVGGWHPLFGQFRRGGHTEHSFRVWRAGLCPAPFTFVEEFAEMFGWHNPPSVVWDDRLVIGANGVLRSEHELIDTRIQSMGFVVGSRATGVQDGRGASVALGVEPGTHAMPARFDQLGGAS